MKQGFGAVPAGRATPRAVPSRPFGDHRGEGAWVEALCIFYEGDCLPQKAANIRNGTPLDYLDRRAIEALKAAFERIAA